MGRIIVSTVCELVGLGLIVFGVSMVSPVVAVIVSGVLIATFGVIVDGGRR